MTEKQQALYDHMMAALSGYNGEDYASGCFWIAVEHWERLKQMTGENFFLDSSHAIRFFKYTKPAFTCQAQFYTMVSEALLCAQQEDGEMQQEYWRKELQRLGRFLARNKTMVKYYDSEASNRDEDYFLKVPPGWVPQSPLVYYDGDINFCSPRDHQIRGLLAHRMYHQFAESKLELKRSI
jgi:hypothetical protein